VSKHFDFRFVVDAPLARVAEFHRDSQVLPRLTPPPIWVRLHRFDPLADGARLEMTMWFGPVPVRWTAVHDAVDPLHGFRDTAEQSPLRWWRHTHRFVELSPTQAEVHEHIEYDHHPGLRGWLSRVVFSRPGLWFLFMYRSWVTKRMLEGQTGARR